MELTSELAAERQLIELYEREIKNAHENLCYAGRHMGERAVQEASNDVWMAITGPLILVLIGLICIFAQVCVGIILIIIGIVIAKAQYSKAEEKKTFVENQYTSLLSVIHSNEKL